MAARAVSANSPTGSAACGRTASGCVGRVLPRRGACTMRAWSHRWQRGPEAPVNLCESLVWQRADRFQPRIQPLGPQRLDAPGCERAADQRPVGLDEAEHPVDGEIATHDAPHDLDLFNNPVD